MKRLLIIVMACILVLVGCNAENKYEVEGSSKSQTSKGRTNSIQGAEPNTEETIDTDNDKPTISEYLVDNEDDANVILMITNQSFHTPTIKLNGMIDNDIVFDSKYKVKDQHEVTNYYVKLPEGKHSLKVASKDASLDEEFEIKADDKLWMFISYWSFKDSESLIKIHKDDKRILIK